MEFQIARTSVKSSEYCEEPVIAGAVWKTFTYVDSRTVSDPAELKCMSAARWYSEGTNHRVEDGKIKRDFPHKTGGWFLEVPDIFQFMLDVKCEVVVDCREGTPYLEIYDDYRE